MKWTGVGGEFWFPWPVVPYGFTPENGCEVNLVSPQRRFVALPFRAWCLWLTSDRPMVNHQLPCKSQELGWTRSIQNPRVAPLANPALNPLWLYYTQGGLCSDQAARPIRLISSTDFFLEGPAMVVNATRKAVQADWLTQLGGPRLPRHRVQLESMTLSGDNIPATWDCSWTPRSIWLDWADEAWWD